MVHVSGGSRPSVMGGGGGGGGRESAFEGLTMNVECWEIIKAVHRKCASAQT